MSGQEGLGGMRNGLGGREEAVGMFASAGEDEIVDFKEVSAGGGSFKSECGVAVERREVVGAGEFGASGGDDDEGGIEARIDGLSLTVEVDRLILG